LVTFFDFQISQASVATYCRWGGNICDVYSIHWEFSYVSVGERILKICSQLPVIIKHQGAYFYKTRCRECHPSSYNIIENMHLVKLL